MDNNSDDDVISDPDIYDDDADLSSFGELKNRIVELPKMEQTEWFQKMTFYPVNLAEMDYFIEQMDIINILDGLKVKKILSYEPKRLDALFILLKMINSFTINFCEHAIHSFFSEEFGKLFYSKNPVYKTPESFNAFLDEYCVDVANIMVRFLKFFIENLEDDVDLNQFIKLLTNKLSGYCYRSLNCEYYTEILTEFGIQFEKEFFKRSSAVFENITIQIVAFANEKTKQQLIRLKKIAAMLINDKVSDEEVYTEIANCVDIRTMANSPSDAIDDFMYVIADDMTPEEIKKKKIVRITQYDNFLYSWDRKINLRRYAFWLKSTDFDDESTTTMTNYRNYYEGRRKEARKKADEIGLKLYPEKGVDSILIPFILHNFVKAPSELIRHISNLMEFYRYDPGIFDKYEAVDLETSFTLIALSNEIDKTYDTFLSEIKKDSKLPFMYPIEFILRLVSRILNIAIKFYDDTMTECLKIDNALNPIVLEPIIICQFSMGEYYLMIPKDKDFQPISNGIHDISINQLLGVTHTPNKRTMGGLELVEV